jgi:hypothetical protein
LSTTSKENINDSYHALFAKFDDALRKDGFTELQIAVINTAVRRALDLE